MSHPQTVDVAAEFAAVNKLYSSGDPIELDPYPMYRRLRDTMPIMDGDILARYKVPSQADFLMTGRKIYTLFRYDDVARALQDDSNFSAGLQTQGLGEFLGDGIVTAYSGEEHRRIRGIMMQAMTPVMLKSWRTTWIEPQIRGHLQQIESTGRADLVRAFSLRFPIDVVYHVMGYPDDRAFCERFAGWALRILAGTGSPSDPDAVAAAQALALEASKAIYDNTLEIVKSRRASGARGNDMMARMIHADFDGYKLEDHMITSLLRAALPAAAETTTRTFGNLLILLLDHPEMMERLSRDRALMAAAISESMRLEPTASFVARETKVDVPFHGVTVPAGTALSLAVGSANRDERVFADPDKLDFDRKMPRPMLSFGSGAHICLGMHLARLEVDVAINAVLDVLQGLRRDPDAPRSVIRGFNMRGPDNLNVCWDASGSNGLREVG